ncbi:MAG: carboxymuconolactone decarboxylase family protein [Pseudomonadota bacterium]|nr:carboxymuconolactone decarboxylase family protein [Pseudomonadota bacterium]
MSKREKGIEMFNEVYCNDLPQPPEKGEDGFFDFMLESLFSELWGNDILTIEQRRLLLLGAIASQGEEMTFTIQARSAMKRGELSFAQLEEIARFMTQYIGYPKASKMRMALMGLKKDFDQ